MVVSERRLDAKFRKRIRRRLYYGDTTNLDAPSLPLTELAVNYFHDSTPRKLGHVDLDTATNIVRENKVSPCSMVVSVMYARRLRERNKKYLETMSSSDVFFISMMMASKFVYDDGTDDEVFNDEWAVSIDQDVADVNKMEVDFLRAMDWRLLVNPEEFEETLQSIEKRLALQQGMKRGWFTYAELDVLTGNDLLGKLWSGVGAECSKLMASLSAAYVTGILSMLSSVVLASQVSVPLSSAAVALMVSQHSPLSVLQSPINASAVVVPYHDPRRSLAMGCSELGCLEGMLTDEARVLDDANRSAPAVLQAAEEQDVKDVDSQLAADRAGVQNPAHGEAIFVTDERWMSKGDDDKHVKEEIQEREENQPQSESPRKLKSSLLSLWFVDSLISQVLSLSGLRKSKQEAAADARHGGALAENNSMFDSGDDSLQFSSNALPDDGMPGRFSSDHGKGFVAKSVGSCVTCRGVKKSPNWRRKIDQRRERKQRTSLQPLDKSSGCGSGIEGGRCVSDHSKYRPTGSCGPFSAPNTNYTARTLSLLSSFLALIGGKTGLTKDAQPETGDHTLQCTTGSSPPTVDVPMVSVGLCENSDCQPSEDVFKSQHSSTCCLSRLSESKPCSNQHDYHCGNTHNSFSCGGSMRKSSIPPGDPTMNSPSPRSHIQLLRNNCSESTNQTICPIHSANCHPPSTDKEHPTINRSPQKETSEITKGFANRYHQRSVNGAGSNPPSGFHHTSTPPTRFEPKVPSGILTSMLKTLQVA